MRYITQSHPEHLGVWCICEDAQVLEVLADADYPAAVSVLASGYDWQAALTAAGDAAPTWEADPAVAYEGVPTSDRRQLEPGSVVSRSLPQPLMWNVTTTQGHQGAVIAGAVDQFERRENGALWAAGRFDTGEMGAEAARLVGEDIMRGVSLDLASADVETEVLAVDNGGTPADWLDRFTFAEMAGMTGTPHPAFADARIKLTKAAFANDNHDEHGRFAPGDSSGSSGSSSGVTEEHAAAISSGLDHLGYTTKQDGTTVDITTQSGQDWRLESHDYGDGEAVWSLTGGVSGIEAGAGATAEPDTSTHDMVQWADQIMGSDRPGGRVASAVAAAGGPVVPPIEWFQNPELPEPTPLTFTEDGRVFGHIATWGTCHIGQAGACVSPPHSATGYAYFTTGVMRCEDGCEIPVGVLTYNTGHAGMSVGHREAASHYDHTGTAVADLAVGEDAFGIWVAGAQRPNIADEVLRVVRASAPSGDWRRIGDSLEMVAVLAVNVPGFPVPRTQARVASGQQVALVAAAAPLPVDPVEQLRQDIERRLERIERTTALLSPIAASELDARMGVKL